MFHYSSSLLSLSLRAHTLFHLGFPFVALQFFEKGVQALEIALPKTPVPLQPHVKLLKRLRPQRINPPLRVNANVNQSGVAKHPQMLGHLWLAKVQAIDHVADGPWPVKQQFDDLKAVGLGQGSKCFYHDEREYASRRIFLSRHILRKEYKSPSFPRARSAWLANP